MNPFPHRVLNACRRSRVVRPSACLGLVAVTSAALVAGASPVTAESVKLSPAGSLVVTLSGNGHGFGMSQYGAQGAAVRGHNYLQILSFYYPGTSAAALKPSTIRVKLSGYGATLTVAALSNLRVSGLTGTLPTSGVGKYRLVRSGSALALQQLRSAPGSTWRTIRNGLPSATSFARPGSSTVRAFATSGRSTRYHGALRLVRTKTSAYVVNRVSLDDYTAGVVGREMPVSWSPQAVDAQAVAARTYGRFAVEEHRKNFDICDTTQCQVYGGAKQYSRAGHRIASEYKPAAQATANRVLRYKGKTIFAQFAASNGGWIADGGKPYLRPKRDPFDSSAPGNPYVKYERRVSVGSLASQFGFAKLTGLSVAKRDGDGTWGGRVRSVVLTGTDAAKHSKRVTISGLDLQWAIGAGTTLFTVRRG